MPVIAIDDRCALATTDLQDLVFGLPAARDWAPTASIDTCLPAVAR